MTHTSPESSPRSCRGNWPSAVFLVVMAAAFAASLSGCMRAGAAPSTARDDAQVRTFIALEKKTPDGWTYEVPLAEEYRAVRPAGDAPAIPPSEMWPAQ